MIDTQLPTFRGTLNAANFVPGQNVILTQSGSTDPTPGSGLTGQYYYENNWTDAVSWTTSNTYSDPVPTPTLGTQATYNVEATAGDKAGNYQWLSNWSYCVDNTYPTGLSLSGVPVVVNSATVNVTTHSTAGGCAGVTNVRISNDGSTWLTGQVANGTISNWNITSGYGGTSAQGTHTIYVAFFEGTSWVQVTTTVTYDTVAPLAPSAPILAAGSDTGTSQTDGLTSLSKSLVFTGSAEAGSTVTLYNGATVIGSGVATGGSYSITTISSYTFPAGISSITVKAADVAGNVGSASSGDAVVIHTTCPN
jgi:hypothetical protein